MAINSYFFPSAPSCATIVIQRSEFISSAVKADDEEQARKFLANVKKQHPFATHNCYAFTAEDGKVAKFSDDGEPQGTAGMPIMEVLKNRGFCNTLIVVTRYFGGVKLGAGGLVRAYSSAACAALDCAEISQAVLSDVFSLNVPYELFSSYETFIKPLKSKILSRDFGDKVTLSIAVPTENAEEFNEKTNGFFSGNPSISRKSGIFISYNNNMKGENSVEKNNRP